MKNEWSEEQLSKLIEFYPNCIRAEDLCSIIGRNLKSIYQKANQLKLKRLNNEGYKNLTEKGLAYRFNKNNTPWNKGMKGIEIGGKETQFKKGHQPWNTRFDGDERIDDEGYTLIRVANSKWKLKHRLIWIEHFGEIPSGNVVKFKDGNKTNFDINNLYCVTKKVNMMENTIHRYPEELRTAIMNLGKLNRKIKQNEAS